MKATKTKAEPKVVPPRDLLKGAIGGDSCAATMLADWYQEHDEHDKARLARVLSFEFHVRAIQAKQVRVMIAATEPEVQRQNAKTSEVRDLFDKYGIPAEAFGVSGSTPKFMIVAPTDGQEVEQSAANLTRWLKATFPGCWFLIEMRNSPISAAGQEAMELLEGEAA